jgi:hypothetical protein
LIIKTDSDVVDLLNAGELQNTPRGGPPIPEIERAIPDPTGSR